MRRVIAISLLVLLAVLNLFPLAYMAVLAASGEAWRELFASAPQWLRWSANSGGIAVLTVLYHLLADSMAGYVLAKWTFRGRGIVLVIVLLALMVPRQVTLIPLFLGMAKMGLADSFLGLLLPGLGDVIGVFLMRQFFLTLPTPLLEAARIDGASEWQIFWHVALPLARPALAVLAVLAFQHYWSDFFWPLVITQTPEHYTLQVGIAYMAQSEFGPNLPLMAACAVLAAAPMLILFMACRKQFFAGLRAGAVK